MMGNSLRNSFFFAILSTSLIIAFQNCGKNVTTEPYVDPVVSASSEVNSSQSQSAVTLPPSTESNSTDSNEASQTQNTNGNEVSKPSLQNKWKITPTQGYVSQRSQHRLTLLGDKLLIYGHPYSGPLSQWSEILDLKSGEVTATPNGFYASERNVQIATDTEFVIWGGAYDKSQGGSALDPKTMVLRKLNNTYSSLNRSAMAYVWTGSEMIVWGGWNDLTFDPFFDGAIVNFKTKVLKTIPAYKPPSGFRPATGYDHNAVWTGSKMLIPSVLRPTSNASGIMYDPNSNTWSKMSPVGAPDIATSNHIWTGDRLIVFDGGVGGIYNPTTDTWKAISKNGAPGKVFSNGDVSGVAVAWTGSKLIAWGGRDDLSNLRSASNYGAIYDPATDQWTPMSLENAPAGRTGHRMIWTGKEVLLIGGVEKAGYPAHVIMSFY